MTDQGNNNGNQGFFITVEGSEGSGKTTSLNFISDWLTDNGIDFIQTREPGGTPLAEQIRNMLLYPEFDEVIDDATELLMVFAARAQHLRHVIKPALLAGKVVVCDRFTDTTWAYQGGGRQMKSEWIAQLETMVQGDIRPDMTLFLDVPVDIGLKRAGQRSAPDRFEKEHIQFFERIRAAYQKRAELLDKQYVVIDSSQTVDRVNEALDTALCERLKR